MSWICLSARTSEESSEVQKPRVCAVLQLTMELAFWYRMTALIPMMTIGKAT